MSQGPQGYTRALLWLVCELAASSSHLWTKQQMSSTLTQFLQRMCTSEVVPFYFKRSSHATSVKDTTCVFSLIPVTTLVSFCYVASREARQPVTLTLAKPALHIPFPCLYQYGGPRWSCLLLLHSAGSKFSFVRENARGLLQGYINHGFSQSTFQDLLAQMLPSIGTSCL